MLISEDNLLISSLPQSWAGMVAPWVWCMSVVREVPVFLGSTVPALLTTFSSLKYMLQCPYLKRYVRCKGFKSSQDPLCLLPSHLGRHCLQFLIVCPCI